MNEILEKAKQNMILKEKDLSPFACRSQEGIWLKEDIEDIRPIFFRDIDRIIHSSGYARYIDKTQVYSFIQNDHITRRVLHVQLVSKIARTIGRSLRLNEDLIEAISLGHDIGHTPFGHKGENLLNSICQKENIGYFCHNSRNIPPPALKFHFGTVILKRLFSAKSTARWFHGSLGRQIQFGDSGRGRPLFRIDLF